MAETNLQNQILALAGCCQAAGMVKDLSQNGYTEQTQLDIAIYALLNQNPETTVAVFGGINHVQNGIQLLLEQLYPAGKRNMDIGRYVANLITLESQLMKNNSLVSILKTRIIQIEKQKNLLNYDNDQIIDSIASLYQDTLSTLPLKIQVTGKARFLKEKNVQRQVRMSLLFGLRCAILWRQLGGKKRDFLFKRKAFTQSIKELQLNFS